MGSGCLLLSKLGLFEKPGAFSHRVHGTEQELECQSCHAAYEESDKAGMPKLRQCLLCHEGIDEKKPPDRKLSAFYGETHQWAPPQILKEEINFSHKLHVVDKGIGCSSCHKGIEESHSISDKMRVFKADCMECHAQAGKSNNCEVCHKEVRQDRKPESHTGLWDQMHGQAVKAHTGKSEDRCSLCHTDASCAACHQDEPPRNHTNFWRQRGHGIAVSIDRSGCATCHREDFCDRCHGEVAPRSHRGSWGSPRENHCITCHTPLSSGECFVCHKGTPSHALATPQPSWHAPAMNCRQCHGVEQPLPHVDNGDNCSTCHQ